MKTFTTNKGTKTLVDDDIYELYSDRNIKQLKAGHVYFWKNNKMTLLHRAVINAPHNKFVDHIDGNPLNNQRSNLRFATNGQNQYNRKVDIDSKTGFKGVYKHKNHKKFMARIKKDGKTLYLGLFVNARDAAIKYNEYASKLFGEFARLNEIK